MSYTKAPVRRDYTPILLKILSTFGIFPAFLGCLPTPANGCSCVQDESLARRSLATDGENSVQTPKSYGGFEVKKQVYNV